MSEYILCAAIHYLDGNIHTHQPKNIDTGYVLCGRRHANIIHTHFILTEKPTRRETSVQGFVTNLDRFVGRSEAMEIAIKAEQVPNDETNVSHDLISEDLY